jgi:predicted RNA-binding Zn ribbon-like protein
LIFAHDTEMALLAAAALVNTDDGDIDRLADVTSLTEFVSRWGWTGDVRHDDEELRLVRALRPRLRQLWGTDRDGVVALVNQLLSDADATPQLVRHDGWDYHLHATPSDAPLATRMAVEAAMAVTDVIRADDLSRLRICEYAGCGGVLIDLSKNRSKRYCERGCGNRAAVAAYRSRKAESASR